MAIWLLWNGGWRWDPDAERRRPKPASAMRIRDKCSLGAGSSRAHVDRSGACEENARLFQVGFPSGQRDQTVNLTRKLRWFESSPHHHSAGSTSPVRGAQLVQRSGKAHPEGGYSSMVEPQPSKLMVRVRFPLPAPAVRCRRNGS